MKKIFKQLKHKLTPTERAGIRRNLVAYMASHPTSTKPRWYGYRLLSSRFVVVTTMALMVVGLTGSTTYAAEDTLPGDLLYPIKINVTEPVHAKLLFNDEAKANWEGERAARRLDEAEKLAKLGRLNEQKQIELEARFTAHTEKLNTQITRLEALGNQTKATMVRQKFNQLIHQHQKKLETLEKLEKSDREETDATEPNRPVRTILRLLQKTKPIDHPEEEMVETAEAEPESSKPPSTPDKDKLQKKERREERRHNKEQRLLDIGNRVD